MLTGLGGADIFRFNNSLGGGNVDEITDYSAPVDRIEIDNAVFTGLAAGALAGVRFVANLSGRATTDNHRIIYETDTGNLFFDADGTGATTRVRFAVLDAGLSITAAEFFVV